MDDAATDELLLDATEVVKNYGAVRALRGASLAVRPGEGGGEPDREPPAEGGQ